MIDRSGNLGLVQTLAQPYVEPILYDGVLRDDPLPAWLKRYCLEPYRGGPQWQLNSTYDVLDVVDVPRAGVTYDPSMNTHQVEAGFQFDIRSKIVPITVDLGVLTTDLWGRGVNLDYLETRLQLAALSISAKIGTDAYKDGQQAARVLAWQGLDEALSDGSTNGYQGVTFASYGTVTRSTDQGVAVTGNAPVNVGSLKLADVEDKWMSLVSGRVKPDGIFTTNKGFSILKRTLAVPYLRLEQKDDQELGFTAMVYNGTPIFFSQYCPGSRVASAADTRLGYTGSLSGETIWYLNSKFLKFYISANPLKSFSLWPFQMIPGTQQATAQYCVDGTLICQPGGNRWMAYQYGATD